MARVGPRVERQVCPGDGSADVRVAAVGSAVLGNARPSPAQGWGVGAHGTRTLAIRPVVRLRRASDKVGGNLGLWCWDGGMAGLPRWRVGLEMTEATLGRLEVAVASKPWVSYVVPPLPLTSDFTTRNVPLFLAPGSEATVPPSPGTTIMMCSILSGLARIHGPNKARYITLRSFAQTSRCSSMDGNDALD